MEQNKQTNNYGSSNKQ